MAKIELLKRTKRFFAGLKNRKGFTLPEVAAVVAITGALAAVVVLVAVDQIEAARVAKAKQNIDGIQAALSLFHKDTGTWPTRVNPNAPISIWALRSGNVNANFPLFGTATTGNVKDPGKGNTWRWPLPGNPIDAMVNHLTIDNPGGSTTTPNGFYTAADVNWAGPYMAQVFNDPWGRNYLVYVRAFTDRKVGGEFVYAWIISGGPNETLDTNLSSPIINNTPATGFNLASTSDDIGVMMFQARAPIAGVSE